MKTECDYLNGWIKKTVTYAKISPKSGEPQRYSWGTQKKKKKKKKKKSGIKESFRTNTSMSNIHQKMSNIQAEIIKIPWDCGCSELGVSRLSSESKH